MTFTLHSYDAPNVVNPRTEAPARVPALSALGRVSMRGDSRCSGEYSALELRPRPTLCPTIAPVGVERLIAVRCIMNRDVVVTGGATGRHYHFAAGQSREIPISDARLLVAEGDFGFSGGR